MNKEFNLSPLEIFFKEIYGIKEFENLIDELMHDYTFKSSRLDSYEEINNGDLSHHPETSNFHYFMREFRMQLQKCTGSQKQNEVIKEENKELENAVQ